jgi:hypothetical protein
VCGSQANGEDPYNISLKPSLICIRGYSHLRPSQSVISKLSCCNNLCTISEFIDHRFGGPSLNLEMVTTRRSSFGIQDGETLALRSKTAPVSIDATQSKKRKEYATRVGSPSRKKRKSFGTDGADEAIEEQMQESNGDRNLLAKPASDSAEMNLASPILDASKGQAVRPKAWLEDDFVPLSPEESVRRSDTAQAQGVADLMEDANVSKRNVHQDENLTTATGPTSDPAKSETQSIPQGLNDNVDDNAHLISSSPIANPRVHKRFGSEELAFMGDEVAGTVLHEDGRDDANAHGDNDGDVSSDEEAPEVVGSKSIAKSVRPTLKAPKRAKKKGQLSSDVKDKIADDERTKPNKDPLIVDSLPDKTSTTTRDLTIGVPEQLGIRTSTSSSRQPSKTHQLFDKSERKPKDIIKDGVTYRTVSDPQSMVVASKRHKVSNLPPKSSSNSWRLKKQIMGRKRVQHVWGGRSAFLRS